MRERTGHRSLECLRMYERTSDKQQQAVSNILSSHSQSSYHAQVTKLDHGEQKYPCMSTCGLAPNMTFANCQVNVNVNHGQFAPVSFTSNNCSSSARALTVTTESHQSAPEIGMPFTEDILKDR